uniref:mRNA (guanine-N(7))-methyltransferase n=1 Tax=Cacopsylla melanoneura TaxID=428564 RepID=A0A8D9EKW0_9HEMI
MDPEDGNTFQTEEYGEEEESEEMMAIRSITEEGFSASKAEEFHRKRNQHRGEARDYRTTTIPDSSYSSANQQHQNNKMSEEMLAIQSIMGDAFDSEYAEQYIQEETVIEQEIVESEQILEDINSEDDLEETIIAAATKASKTNERLSNETHDKSSKEEIFQERLPNETSTREKQPKKKIPREKQPKEKSSKANKLKETESNDRPSHDRDRDRTDGDRIDRDRPSESDRLSPSEPDDESEEGGLGQTVAEHYNMKKNVGTELRKNSRIVYMRNFNNWTKSMLIDEFLSRLKAAHPLGSPIRVLDMGSGKGGDMLKWKNGGVKHVVFADIAALSIEDCKTRYEELKTKEEAKAYSRNVFSAEFIAVDCSKKRLRSHYEDKALELDLVSCQFCIHYSFESVQQARTMLKNAAECLKPGGYFVGTVPDSNQIISRQRKHPNVSFGSDVYRIECLFDVFGPIPLFGAKYDFNLEGVVNCPEFLVHFGLFERIAGEFGLKLVLKENFKLFYERKSKDHSARQLLRRMNAMETYPPSEGVDTVGQDADYCHAEAYLSEHQNNEKLGTLSKAEWEAITLYQVFAFEKVKGKGTPADSSNNSNSTNRTSCSSPNKRLAEDSLDSVSSDSSDSKLARTSPDNT